MVLARFCILLIWISRITNHETRPLETQDYEQATLPTRSDAWWWRKRRYVRVSVSKTALSAGL